MATDHVKKIEKIRGQIDALRIQIESNESPRIDFAAALARAESRVDDLAERFQLDIHDLFTPGARFEIPADDTRELLALIAWVNPGEMKQRLREALEDAYEGYSGPIHGSSHAESVRKLRDELFALEVEEERAIVASEDAGTPVPRRMDANPEAVLAVT